MQKEVLKTFFVSPPWSHIDGTVLKAKQEWIMYSKLNRATSYIVPWKLRNYTWMMQEQMQPPTYWLLFWKKFPCNKKKETKLHCNFWSEQKNRTKLHHVRKQKVTIKEWKNALYFSVKKSLLVSKNDTNNWLEYPGFLFPKEKRNNPQWEQTLSKHPFNEIKVAKGKEKKDQKIKVVYFVSGSKKSLPFLWKNNFSLQK